MKLLGWVHRKFRQNSADAFKDNVANGPTCNCLCVRPPVEERHRCRRRSVGDHGLFAEAGFADGAGESVLFEGLLNIGTLGSGEEMPIFGKPVTVDDIAEKEDEEATTEAELMVVGAELEKVLAAEVKKEDGDRMSSAGPKNGTGKGPAGVATCPLQGYLFGSPVEVAKTAEPRDRRASLGDLFMLNKVAEEEEVGGEKGAADGGGDVKRTAGTQLMMVKKMLRRRGSSKASGSSGGGAGTTTDAPTKYNKILQMFHRKVHPEDAITSKKVKRSFKCMNRENNPPHDGSNDSDTGSCYSSVLAPSKNPFRVEGNPGFKSHSISGGSNSSGNREYWIRTDSDYLVLEL